METFKQRIITEKFMPLNSDNEGYGFFGTIARNKSNAEAKKRFYQASMFLAKKKISTDTQDVRDFLDSGYGRHWADEIVAGEKLEVGFYNYFKNDATARKHMKGNAAKR